jgi:hypothetical protein
MVKAKVKEAMCRVRDLLWRNKLSVLETPVLA